ncbi:MAG: GGDEF domain-containing protein [Deltaproteobacteria bacterium]|nr:GGDEF domain-containing protein [Deltaproteobacteria bacterium]
MTVSSEAIAYLQQQAPVIFLVLEENGVVVAANEHTKEVFGGSPVGKHFKDLIIDFRHNFSIDKINEDPSRETLINITTGSGLPRSYYFTFKKLSGHFIVFGRIDFEEFEKMQREVISLNKDLNNLTRELYKKNALLKKTNDDLKIANDKIVEISRRDPLTQLYNRRYFEEKKGLERIAGIHPKRVRTIVAQAREMTGEAEKGRHTWLEEKGEGKGRLV